MFPQWLLLLPLLLLVMWLGARDLDTSAVWYDEYYSIHDAGGAMFGPLSPAGIWERVAERNPWHAPGFFVLLSGWGQLVGWSPTMLRAFALLMGLLAVAWTYRLGRDLVAPRVGLYAAVILGSSAFFIHYLHELRMYTLFVLLSAFTIWVYFQIIDRNGRVGVWGWLGLLTGTLGLLYTHYFAALPLVAVGVYHLIFARKDRRWWFVSATFALAGLLFLPWLGALIDGLNRAAAADWVHVRALSTPAALEKLALLFGNGGVILFVAVMGAGVVAWWQRRDRGSFRVWVLVLVLVATILAVNAALQIMHGGRVRYWMSTWALLAIIAALGILQLERLHPALSRIALVGWVLFGIWNTATDRLAADLDGTQFVYPMHEVAPALRDYVQPRDALVQFLPMWLSEWVHQDIAAFYLADLPLDYRLVETTDDLPRRATDRSIMQAFAGDRDRVWVAYMPENHPETVEQYTAALNETFYQCPVPVERATLRLEQYTRSAVCCVDDSSASTALVRYENGIALTGVDAPLQVGDSLALTLGWWLPPAVPPHTFSYAVHLLNTELELVAQGDAGLLPQTFDCRPLHIDLSAVPPGTYQLAVIVYAWETGARLSGTVTATGEVSQRAVISGLRVR